MSDEQPKPAVERYDVPLPSGRTASFIKHGKGKHLKYAGRIATNMCGGGQPDQMSLTFAMVCVKGLIDGQPIHVEQLDEMDEKEVGALMAGLNGPPKPKPKDGEDVEGKATGATTAENAGTPDTSSSPNVT